MSSVTQLVTFALCPLLWAAYPSSSLSTPRKRVALITGANKGIGKEIARQIGSQPNLVAVLGCRDEKLGIAARDDLSAQGCDTAFVQLELTDPESIQSARDYIDSEYGCIDVLVNNAAICFNDPTLYGKCNHTPFKDQAGISVNTNFFGTLAVTQAFLSLLRKAASPRIVNVASAAGRLAILRSREKVEVFTNPELRLNELEAQMRQFVSDVEDGTHESKGWPNTCYGMSKLGLIALTKIISRDEPTMMVNSVDPGYCATDQNNNQGFRSAERGAVTPFLLATLPDSTFLSGKHWFDEAEVEW